MLFVSPSAHDGQFDKGGKPYITHCLKVYEYVNSDDEELNCIAILHDVIEDCDDMTYSYLEENGMTARIIDGVKALTKHRGQTAEEYLNGILNNVDAMHVKMADLRHNMDIRRLKGVSEKDLSRLAKYATMYRTISEKLKGLDNV